MRSTLPLALVVLAALLVWAPPAGAAPDVVQGAAVVDGDYSEWDLGATYFADMYRAGNPDKVLESKLYLQYDCLSGTMFVLVLDEPGVVGFIVPDAVTSWIALNDVSHKVVNELAGIDGYPPDFAWIGRGYDGDPSHVLGYEASFSIASGAYTLLGHTEVWDVTGQTSATIGCPKEGVPLFVPNCTVVPVRGSTWGALKAAYR